MEIKKKSFSVANIFLENWPFPKGEAVVLHWLKSPEMLGEEKQWMMNAVFKRQNGSLCDYRIPWGMLPMLRLGKEFIDGFETGKNDMGDFFTISFSEKAFLKTEESYTAVSKNGYPLITKKNLQEQSVVIFEKTPTVVIPCLEIIRSFFAINKALTQKMLQPYDFSEFVVGKFKEKMVFLKFTKQVPRYILNYPAVKLVANILFNSTWVESWQQIYIEREKLIATNHLRSTDLVPLKCIPPVFKNSLWQVRAIKDGKRIFVLEILKCIDKNPSIFEELNYTHPRSNLGGKRKYYQSSTNIIDYNANLMARNTLTGPKNPKRPIIIKNPISAYFLEQPIKIKEVPYQSTIEEDKITRIGIDIEKTRVNKRNTINISFNDEGKKGNSLAAEFIPTEDNDEIPNGLKDFFDAINIIKEWNPNLEISYTINTTPKHLVLAKCGLELRKYALVKVKYKEQSEVYIIEFDLSDKHNISTLFLSPANLCFVEELLNNYIIGQGNWAKENIEKIENIKVAWAKHTSVNTYLLGEKIIEKVKKIIA